MTPITTLAAISFILADAELGRYASIAAPPAGPLPIATFLALPAALAARLGREIRLLVLSRRQGHCRVRGNRGLARDGEGKKETWGRSCWLASSPSACLAWGSLS